MANLSTLFSACAVAVATLALTSGAALAQAADTDLPLGEVVEDEPKAGETYVKGEFGDWALRCVVIPNADDRCQLYQLLFDTEENPIAEFTLLRLPEGTEAAAGATVIVPLETSLADQLTIKVDDDQAKRYPFAFCNQVGCFARLGLTADDIEKYKQGNKAVLSIVPVAAPDQRVVVEMSLTGFTAGFEAASQLQ